MLHKTINSMRKILTTNIFIFIHLLTFSQGKDTLKIKPYRFVRIETGYTHESYRDAGLSPLLYSGSMPIFSAGFRASSNRYIMDVNSSVIFGNYYRTISGAKYLTNAINFDLTLDYFRKIQSSSYHWHFFMGSGISGFLSARNSPQFMNSSFVMNIITNLSLDGRVQYNFKLPVKERKILFIKLSRPERKYILSLDLFIPFATMAYYPGYSFVSHATVNNNNELSDYQWNVHVFSSLRTRTEFYRLLDNGNAFGLAYTFHFFSSKNYLVNYLQMAGQSVSLSLLCRFN